MVFWCWYVGSGVGLVMITEVNTIPGLFVEPKFYSVVTGFLISQDNNLVFYDPTKVHVPLVSDGDGNAIHINAI